METIYKYGTPGKEVCLRPAGKKFIVTTKNKLPLFVQRSKDGFSALTVKLPSNRILGVGASLTKVDESFPDKMVKKIHELPDGGFLLDVE
jgi:hypothetical protein